MSSRPRSNTDMSEYHEGQGSHIELRAESSLEEEIASLSIAEPLYRPLLGSEIRLIRIGPGSWEDPISCDLIYVPLNDLPKYVALSYAWGDPTETQPILLNGHMHHITISLFSGLRRLREMVSVVDQPPDTFIMDRLEDLYLWADAICINQDDTEEKNQQIFRMGVIYTSADRVCVWLGENPVEQDDDIHRLMHLIRAVSSTRNKRSINLTELIGRSGRAFKTLAHAYVQLGSRRWFSRVWVIQEVVLAVDMPILLAGGAWSSMEWFFKLGVTMNDYENGLMRNIQGNNIYRSAWLFQIRTHYKRDRENGEVSASSLSVLGAILDRTLGCTHGFFDATLPHDYIYGLLGLIPSDALPHSLAPNYSEPYPIVCQQYAKFILESTGNLSIILRLETAMYGVPSWVPDFRCLAFPWRDPDKDQSPISFSEDGNRMSLIGRDLGTCTWVNKPPSSPPRRGFTENTIFQDALQGIDNFFIEAARVKHVTKDEVLENWLQSLGICDGVHSPDDLKTMYYAWLRHQQSIESEEFKQLSSVAESVGRFSAFVTEHGLVASLERSDQDAELGDVLVAVKGTTKSLLLRPTTEVNEYLYVGYCNYRQPFDVEAALLDRASKEFIII